MFPGGRCEGESAQSCEARVFPPRAPPFWARILERTLWWVLRYWWGDGFCGIQGVRLSRWARADGKAARAAGLFPVFGHNLQHPTKSNPSPRQQSNTFHNAEQRRGREGRSARRGAWPSQLRMLPLLAPAACKNAPSRKGKHLPHAKMLPPLERDSLPIDFMLE